MRITYFVLLPIVGFLTLHQTHSQYIPKPWPTYSLDNMPRTDFSCHGKILGGYYADAETQCQMFHVCVKVAGVGVKDFRFLCPNGTAFDQEAQICADWGDVDCEQATLYYSSDNFDLYRLGSGFESKRAPVAEDEQPFHLQNAESNDLRRTSQHHSGPSFHRVNVQNYNDANSYNKQSYDSARNIPKVTTTTTTTTTSEAPYQADRRGDDEIFKGSHSSNFFNNRNNGKEEDLVDFPQKPQPQRNYNIRGRQRPQNNHRNNFVNNNNNIQAFPTKATDYPVEQTSTTTSTTTFAPPTTARFRVTSNGDSQLFSNHVKTVSLQSSFRTSLESQNNNGNNVGFYSSTTEVPQFQQGPFQSTNNFFKTTTQQRVQPTTYSPPHSPFLGSSPGNEEYKSFDKTSTTAGQKFKHPSQNSFYNAQFENKATESYDQVRSQEAQNPPIPFDIVNKTASNTNDFVRTVPKTGNRINNFQRQSSFNDRQQESYNNAQNAHNARPNSFDENPINQESSQNLGVSPVPNNFEQTTKSHRSRRPVHHHHHRGSNNFNSFNKPTAPSDANIGNPLSVRPLEIQSQTSTTTESVRLPEQSSFNTGYGGSFRSASKTSQSPSPIDYNTPTGFGVLDLSRASPSPFSLPTEQRRQPERQNNTAKQNDRFAQNAFQALSTLNESPRGFSLNPPYQNQNNQQQPPTGNANLNTNIPTKKHEDQSFDNYTPASQVKKFSTLVPKDQFYPTTFRPATYKKVIQGYEQKIATSTKYAASSYLPTSTSTTQRPQQTSESIDEDDGQYHPELYEKEYVRNKQKPRNPQPQQQQQQQQQYDRTFNRRPIDPPTDAEDDEFLNTAHSLNIAAGANQLRAEKTKQSSLSTFRAVPTGPTITTSTTTTRKPTAAKKNHHGGKGLNKNKKGQNDDASYDYAYYDSFSGNPQDYEYDLISEFGKTRKN